MKINCNIQVVVYVIIFSLRNKIVLLQITIVEDSLLRRGSHFERLFCNILKSPYGWKKWHPPSSHRADTKEVIYAKNEFRQRNQTTVKITTQDTPLRVV